MSPTLDADGSVPNYVKELIRKIADREGFVDYVITNSSGSSLGDGFQADLLRFKIKGKLNNVSASLSLVCKVPSPNPLRRIEFGTDVTFNAEIYLYDQLMPYFMEFQKEHGIYEEDGFYSFPKCYGTIFDERPNGDHAIVMEDLVCSGYSLWNKLKDIDYDHTKLVMEELGKFHAVSFAIRDKNPEKLKEIMSKGAGKFHKMMYTTTTSDAFHNTNVNKTIKAIEHKIQPNEKKIIEKLEGIRDTSRLLRLIDEVFSHTTPEPFGVVVHGDVWNNNIMYQYNDKRPSKVSFIDWQSCQFGSPALDVIHYIFCSLDHVIRAKHYEDFVNLYYDSLTRTLRKFGCDDQKLMKFTDLKDQIQKYGGITLIVGPLLSQIMSFNPENAPDLDAVVEQWQETGDNVEMFGDLSGTSFGDRVLHLLRDCVREGFF